MPPTCQGRNASRLADPGPLLLDLELDKLYMKDLRSLCNKLNLTTTGGCIALVKRIEEARPNAPNLPGTPPPNQDGVKHVESPLKLQFQQLQRQVQELLDRETSQDGLLSPMQLAQVQLIVQGSLNEVIEKAASAAAQAAVNAFHNGLFSPASTSATQVSSKNERSETTGSIIPPAMN